MSKLKRLIGQLTDKDLQIIYNNLKSSEAHKSADLLKLFRESKMTDEEIKDSLQVNNNAFYTLRSRLNEKIETYFLEQSDTPRTVLLQQVAAVGEIMLSQNRTIAIATLKKLEKELLHYDLSNELTIVYKALKKLTMYTPESYEYSQLYNKHHAYMLAQDKAEDMVVDYFSRYNRGLYEGGKVDESSLSLILENIYNTSQLYQSHRLYVFHSCAHVFHALVVEEFDQKNKAKVQELLAIFNQVEQYFDTYRMDPTYHNLKWVFKYLLLIFYYKRGMYEETDQLLKELNPVATHLLVNYSLYTSPIHFLQIKLERYLAEGQERKLLSEFNKYFKNFEENRDDVVTHLAFTSFKGLTFFLNKRYKDAIDVLAEVTGVTQAKQYQLPLMDVKLLLASAYYCVGNKDKANFLINNVQRQIRLLGREQCEYAYIYMKITKSAMASLSADKRVKKVANYIEKYADCPKPFTSPLRFINTGIFEEVEELVQV